MRWLVAVVLLVLVSVACAPARSGPPDCGVPTDGQRVVVEVAGTSNDPRPTLTSRALDVLRAAAESDDARDGRGARGSIALVVSTDGTVRRPLPLTPRRDNCEVEHGLQRERLIHANLGQVLGAVATTSAATPGLDLLAGTDNAVRGLPSGTLIVVGNALGTAGGFDLRQVGWTTPPQDLVRQLDERGLLRDMLTGWRVLFIGVGEAVGAQLPLTKPTRDTLVGYLCAIVPSRGRRELRRRSEPPRRGSTRLHRADAGGGRPGRHERGRPQRLGDHRAGRHGPRFTGPDSGGAGCRTPARCCAPWRCRWLLGPRTS